MKKIAILGAGLAGVELGRRLHQSGHDFVIFEKEAQIGGLCRTFRTGRHSWDLGVHAIYSRHAALMRYFNSLPLAYEHCERRAGIWHSDSSGGNRLLDYPFENGVRDLPFRQKMECLSGYVVARLKRGRRSPANLEEWIRCELGPGIARYFMMPYNQKIWNCPLSEISLDLVNAKIEPASAIRFLRNVLGKKTVGREYQSRFIYPRGGIQQLIDYTAKDIRNRILLNAPVQKLIRRGNGWRIESAGRPDLDVDGIVSTIPLVELLEMVDLPGLDKNYAVFKWNDTFFVMVGLKAERSLKRIGDCHWIFFKEGEIFYRITHMRRFSPDFAATLVAEITAKAGVPFLPSNELLERVIQDLLARGILDSASHIESTDVQHIRHTYPIPTVGMIPVRSQIQQCLQKAHVFLLGRSGNWDYLNMDGVLQSVDLFYSQKLRIELHNDQNLPQSAVLLNLSN